MVQALEQNNDAVDGSNMQASQRRCSKFGSYHLRRAERIAWIALTPIVNALAVTTTLLRHSLLKGRAVDIPCRHTLLKSGVSCYHT